MLRREQFPTDRCNRNCVPVEWVAQPVEKILRDGDTVLPWGQAERSIVIEMSSPDDRAKRLYRVSAGITRRSTAAAWI